jgi:23S rRNA pseudouridine1911/1915/1917 synthase
MRIDFIVSETSAGQRLDVIVSRSVPDCSRSLAAALIGQGDILVSGNRKRPGYRVRQGDRIFGEIVTQPPHLPVGSDSLPVNVIHEDAHIIVVNKPPGLVVHPSPGTDSGTLVNRLIHHFPDLRHAGEDMSRPGIVHRLDKDTSGLILVARTAESLLFLQKEFRYHRVEKNYLALVSGSDLAETGDILLPVGRHPKHRKRMCVNHDTGKPARTAWQVLQRFERACLVRIRLYTGRTHQIRVHFYDMGYPLLGDLTYQFRRNRKSSQPYPRQMLHAWQIGFRHPYSGHKVRFDADPPQDFIFATAGEAGMTPEDGAGVWQGMMSNCVTDKAATAPAAAPRILPETEG